MTYKEKRVIREKKITKAILEVFTGAKNNPVGARLILESVKEKYPRFSDRTILLVIDKLEVQGKIKELTL